MIRSPKWLLVLLGFLLIAIYLVALKLGDLRKHTVEFEWLFFLAFVIYGIACFIALRSEEIDRLTLYAIFLLTTVMQGILVFTRPTLSDDMYRYVWDGRVQAQGISPYRYPPNAPELTSLRDSNIYPNINRKNVVTVYPPAAETAYFLLWRILPDNVHWFQVAMATGGLLAAILLVGLLKDLGYSPARALIFLWSPLLIFETAHAAHVDGLVVPFLVGAWWARVREKDVLTGFLLGVATAMKFYPALLFPFLWRPQDRKGRWMTLLTFAATIILFYTPYLFSSGKLVLGYLPNYFQEKFNVSPFVSILNHTLNDFKQSVPNPLALFSIGILFVMALWCVLHPAKDGENALRRCIMPIGIVTLFSQNLFSWYMVWLLPLTAIFLQPSNIKWKMFTFPKIDAWLGWWLFCGLVGLSYTFFIQWKPVSSAIQVEFIPLYLILFVNLVTVLWKKLSIGLQPTSIQQSQN